MQIRRASAGIFLIDPIDHPQALTPLIEALAGPEWILHAADQDLPSLRELGFQCHQLFDTELAGRLAGLPRVNLATMVEHYLHLGLAKGHGAADWSQRPLPADWLNYAALDVECLVELRDAVADDLTTAGKIDWARAEFEFVRTRPTPPPKAERWRRTSQMHRLSTARQLAMVRALWTEREEVAQRRDIAPGRVLPDAAIVDAVLANPATVTELTALPVFRGRQQRRQSDRWFRALERGRASAEKDLPRRNAASTSPPPTSRWSRTKPEAAQRYSAVRQELLTVSEQIDIPTENLVQPDTIRQLCWDGLGKDPSPEAVDAALRDAHARDWQRALTAVPIARALTNPTAPAASTTPSR